MEYSVEELSPVKKKISVSVPAQEVNAALTSAMQLLKGSVQIDGFRKGKVPTAIVENKFHDQIYSEARDNLVDVHINDILQAQPEKPVAGLEIDFAEPEMKKDKDYAYTITYEFNPKFDLPNYEGLEVEQTRVVVPDKDIEEVMERVRRENSTLEPVEGNGPAKDGEIAVIDFDGYENGEKLQDVGAQNFTLELSPGKALKEFADLVKGIPLGHTAEGDISFPDDFINQDLAGKTIQMKVRVNAIKKYRIPEFDDALAAKMGQKTAADLKDLIVKSYTKITSDVYKSEAESKILEQLLKQTDFPLPDRLVDIETSMLINDFGGRLAQQGIALQAIHPDLDKLKAELRPRAEELVRNQILLTAIADKENITISDQELVNNVYQTCMRHGEDFKAAMKDLRDSGMIFHLKDKMLADKAMDFVYSKANVTLVDPPDPDIDKPEAAESDTNTETSEQKSE